MGRLGPCDNDGDAGSDSSGQTPLGTGTSQAPRPEDASPGGSGGEVSKAVSQGPSAAC